MSLSGIFKFIIGFAIGIALLAGGAAVTAYYFWVKLSAVPAKPIFAEERANTSPNAKKAASLAASTSQLSSKPNAQKLPEKPLPPGAYKARVTWPEGLSLRDGPGSEAARIGGVTLNQEVFVLKESDDQRWQQVRLVQGEQEGWIKAGNIEKIN
ncbi:MAG: SH3 domain-containing protein [Coleofasciculus sp. Co-bin14]|nr:SH3 domain-containing protein [Coleofasciculus sp. Co-bin14]